MDTETLSGTRVGKLFIKLLAKAMESKFRYKFYPPEKILNGTPDLQGLTVLEIGCGTGFFTIPIAKLVGENGSLSSIDILQESVDLVSNKLEAAKITHVNVFRRSAIQTDFNSETFDMVILFGVVPAPMVPLDQIILEINRVLKPRGVLSIWPMIPGLQRSIQKQGSFSFLSKKNKVLNFSKN
jgi:ubiquinone/menaquinone biosynthesis C-methylase UbiE